MVSSTPVSCEAWILLDDGHQRHGQFVSSSDSAVLRFECDSPPGERSVDLLAAVVQFRSLGTREQFNIYEFADALTWDVRLQPFPLWTWLLFGFFRLEPILVMLGATRAFRRFAIFAIQLDAGESLLFAVTNDHRRRVIEAEAARQRRRKRRSWWPFRRG